MNGLDVTRSHKSLNTTRVKLQKWIKECRNTRDKADADMIEAQRSLAKTEAQIAAIENGTEVVVSEHAILRYLERFEGLDTAEIAEKVKRISPELVIKRGSTIVTITDGVRPETAENL